MNWLKDPRMAFGFILMLILAALALVIALGRVEKETSFGLDIIIGGLLGYAGGFTQWAYGRSHDEERIKVLEARNAELEQLLKPKQ